MRKFLMFLLVLGILTLLVFFGVSKFVYSSGERAGTISKFSHRGFVFKTYEGELNVGGFSGQTGNLTPQIWNFSVPAGQESIVKVLDEAVTSGKRVKLRYEEHLVTFPWIGDTKYHVVEADFAE